MNYEGMSVETLARHCDRMDDELTMMWQWYDNLRYWMKLALPCEYCGAQYGQECRTKSGRRASYQHSSREYQFQEIRGEWP